jgi:hypothetical protein
MAHGGRKEAAGPIRDVPVGGSREYIMRAPIVGQFGMLAAPDQTVPVRRGDCMWAGAWPVTAHANRVAFSAEARVGQGRPQAA